MFIAISFASLTRVQAFQSLRTLFLCTFIYINQLGHAPPVMANYTYYITMLMFLLASIIIMCIVYQQR